MESAAGEPPLNLDLGLDLICPQGLFSSRLKAPPVRMHTQPQDSKAEPFLPCVTSPIYGGGGPR